MAKLEKTVTDYVTMAFSPVLIMALVGSLVFFLVEVFYESHNAAEFTLKYALSGPRYILFFFVLAAVLIARIAMTPGIAERAPLYGAVLGGAVFLALLRFVEYPKDVAEYAWLLNLLLIGIIWWSAHRLTWDCTLIDDQQPAGRGLLVSAGLERNETAPDAADVSSDQAGKDKAKKKEGALAGWWGRFQAYREKRRQRPQAPGVWVVYFSLAALPLYGLGQARIPLDQLERRAYVFWLMVIYGGSGLGLLLSTSFLDARRYLRQRKLSMPGRVAATWMVLGVILVALMLGLGALLPRPHDPHPFWDLVGVQAPTRQASRQAPDGDDPGVGKGKGAGPAGKEKAEGDDPQGDKEDPDAKQGKSGKGRKKQGQGQGGQDKAAQGKEKGQDGGAGQKGPKDDNQGGGGADNILGGLGDMLPVVAGILKFLVILVIVIMVLWAAVKFLANFTLWARNLLAWLNGWWQRGQTEETESASGVPSPPPPVPFSAFHDPFLTGASERMAAEALVRYSYAALEAWARQRKLPRRPEETPLEFSRRLGDEVPALEESVRDLTRLYVRLAYTSQPMPVECVVVLRTFWATLDEVSGRALSAPAR